MDIFEKHQQEQKDLQWIGIHIEEIYKAVRQAGNIADLNRAKANLNHTATTLKSILTDLKTGRGFLTITREKTAEIINGYLSQIDEIKELAAVRAETIKTQIAGEPGTVRGLTLKEIALICIYTGKHIDTQTAADILKKFNPGLTSTKKLIEKYSELYTSPQQRRELIQNKSADKKIIISAKKVVEYLKENGFDTTAADNDFIALNKKFSSLYE